MITCAERLPDMLVQLDDCGYAAKNGQLSTADITLQSADEKKNLQQMPPHRFIGMTADTPAHRLQIELQRVKVLEKILQIVFLCRLETEKPAQEMDNIEPLFRGGAGNLAEDGHAAKEAGKQQLVSFARGSGGNFTTEQVTCNGSEGACHQVSQTRTGCLRPALHDSPHCTWYGTTNSLDTVSGR